jgi:hypothetical protein
MPPLVRLYIRHCAIGFLLSAIFVGMLFALDVGHLWSLVRNSDVGLMAAFMLFMGNGIVFAGVQFGITIMRMGEEDDRPAAGLRQQAPIPIPVRTDIPPVARRH